MKTLQLIDPLSRGERPGGIPAMPSGRATPARHHEERSPMRARLRSLEGVSQRELVALSLLLVPNAEAGHGA
jgi:hypothetical protein